VVLRKDSSAAIGVLGIRSDSYKEQIKTIETFHKAEADEKEKINKKFVETLEKVDVELKKSNDKLDRNKKKRVKEIVEKHSDNPERLAQLVKESFGFEIVE
jgi:tRNA A37 N6-isopentenylltransferase MiaA